MKHSNLEAAQSCLQAAHAALIEELRTADTYALHDAANLTADALSQVRGEIKARLPEYPIYDRRAS
jgi:hypothetical protein